MAGLSLLSGAPRAIVKIMMERIEAERKQVQSIIRGELEKMMKMGAEVTEMTYNSKGSFNLERSCRKPEHIRKSYIQDGLPMNIQCVHFISHELHICTYQGVMMKCQSHRQYVCQIVERKMRIQWATQKLDLKGAHRNSIQHVYGGLSNERKMIICCRNNGCPHNRFPFLRNPKLFKDSNCSVHYKKGNTIFYWWHGLLN
jgi:hypothetical protein